ncbi:MAG TPA: HAMP domain-containing sensor histidine kinase [Dongiaceae bacterium]|nr:HAMP domain-containing sensor histidine kinase [Dongiaceae bacterium]
MNRMQPGRPRPSVFLWQAAFILLPVLVLAVLALISLRQDRLLADQTAREMGTSQARQLAAGAGAELDRQLQDYLVANDALQTRRLVALGLTDATNASSEATPSDSIQNWQQAHPDLDLAAQPLADCRWTSSDAGRQPRFYPLAPVPPEWWNQLTAEQRQGWHAAEQVEFSAAAPEIIHAAMNRFLASASPAAARTVMEAQWWWRQTRDQPPAVAVSNLVQSGWVRSDALNEAGLPLGQLLGYQALRRLPDRAGVPEDFLHDLIGSLQQQPSILAGGLLAELERTGAAAQTNPIAALNGWWQTGEHARQVLREWQRQQPGLPATNALEWLNVTGERFLLAFSALPTAATASNTPAALAADAWRVRIIPAAVVAQALNLAARRMGLNVPDYAGVGLDFASRTWVWQRNQFVPGSVTAEAPVLGRAEAQLTALSDANAAYPLRAQVLLTSREQLYARQRQRTLLVGALILAASGAALAGLFATHRAFRRQQELNRLQSNFVSSVSHELRAPIAAVRLMAENLEGGKIPERPQQQEYFGFIVQECRRLSSLIENVLDFSRIEQGRKQYEFEPADLAGLVQTTVQLLRPYAAEKGVVLEIAPASLARLEWKVDARAIQQALVNLLDNAIKHSAPQQTVTVTLECLTTATPTRVRLIVADQGPGIPAAEQEKIFERFYRRGSELRRETQGVGIGLSLVRHIAQAHGGHAGVESEVGQGSRFWLELPVQP